MFTKVLVNGLCDKQTLVNLHNIFQGLIITPLGGGGVNLLLTVELFYLQKGV